MRITSIDDIGINFQWTSVEGRLFCKREMKHTGFLSWNDVLVAHAFKRDLFSNDQICVVLTPREGESVEFDEDAPKWLLLMEKMATALPASRKWEHWFSEVAHPAFQPNLQVIYQR